MLFSWLRRRRRARLVRPPFPAHWLAHLEALPFHGELSTEERTKLGRLIRVFIAEKRWEGCGGLAISEQIEVTVAAQACLLILNLGHDYYHRVQTILVYPSAFQGQALQHLPGGGVLEGVSARAGEAWSSGGPVILSWDAAFDGGHDPADGRNLVFHEFAHKLDALDGYIDGIPPLRARDHYRIWREVVEREYQELVQKSEHGEATLLDAYGATAPAEFFAVATECFFELPRRMQPEHPDLYELLRTFYGQDPAARPIPKVEPKSTS